MRATTRLLQQCRITMFTRDNCSLCTDAKSVLSSVWDRRQFRYEEVNLAKSEAKQWKDLYDFDIPVVHFSKADAPEDVVENSGNIAKLMHRFTAKEVELKMDAVEAPDVRP